MMSPQKSGVCSKYWKIQIFYMDFGIKNSGHLWYILKLLSTNANPPCLALPFYPFPCPFSSCRTSHTIPYFLELTLIKYQLLWAVDITKLSLDVNVAHNLVWVLCHLDPQFRILQTSGHDFFFGHKQKCLENICLTVCDIMNSNGDHSWREIIFPGVHNFLLADSSALILLYGNIW